MTATKRLRDYISGYTRQILIGILFVVVSIGVEFAIPFITRYAIDDVVARNIDLPKFLLYAGLYLGASAIAALFGLLTRRTILNMSHSAVADIRTDLFNHLSRLDYAFFSKSRTGDIMNRSSSDLDSVRELIGYGIHQGARTLIGFIVAFAIMFSINTSLATIMLVLFPIISIFSFVLLKALRRRYEKTQEQFSTITNFTQETLTGIRTIKGFGIESRRFDGFGRLNLEYIDKKMALSRTEAPIWPMMGFFFSLGVVLLLLVGGQLIIRNELTLGQFVQFLQYLNRLQWPMIALGWTLGVMQRGWVSWGRVRKIMDTEPEIKFLGEESMPASTNLEYRDVSLNLGGQTILKDIDLSIEPGSSLGITGPTGSGKTLLVWLLVRLIDPTTGMISLAGRDIRQFKIDELRKRIGMAPQEPFLFSESLAYNIGFGLDAGDSETIEWAAEVAQLGLDIKLFPEGYETLIGERGITLSGGQKQRTAISRAIARNPDILILDDIFSAIDTQTESKILEQLLPLLESRSTLLISHRVTTLRHTDRIVVLEGGRITQQGSHEELVSQPGYYRDLDEMQRLEARLEAE
ncbi:MAG: ABC transporter ATP-binding protein [Verrucomicrobiota bacterium]